MSIRVDHFKAAGRGMAGRLGRALTGMYVLANFVFMLPAQEKPSQVIEEVFERAQEALRLGESEAAESDARFIISASLDQLGALYQSQGRWEEAEKAYLEAARASAFAAESLMGLGIVYLRSGQYEEGRRTLKQLLRLNPLNPDPHHLLGKILFMQGDYQGASSELRDAYSLGPGDMSVAYTLALAYLKQQRPEEARRVFAEMEERVGSSPPSIFFSGVVLASDQRHEEALPLLERACRLQPERPDPHLFLGQTLLKLNRIEPAIDHLRRAIQLTRDPEADRFRIANAHFSLGQALLRSGRREEARVHIETSRRLKRERFEWEAEAVEEHMKGSSGGRSADAAPATMGGSASSQLEAALASHGETSLMLVDLQAPESDPRQDQTVAYYRRAASNAYQLLGRIQAQRGEFAQSARALGLAADWDGENADLYFNWGLACMKADQPECAVEPLVADLKRNPQRDAAKGMLAQAALQLVESKDSATAGQAVEFLIALHPEVADLHLLKGRVLAVEGRFQEAQESFQQARRLNPSIPEVHYFEGMALLRQSKMDEALESFSRQLEKTPHHAKALYHKAFLLDALGRAAEAPPLLEQAIAADPGYAQPYYQLGKMQLKEGKLPQATMNLETASRLSPQASYIHYQLSRAYSMAGRKEAAQEALTRYRELKKLEEEVRLESIRQPVSPPDSKERP